jgi:hypothetical protein
MARLKATQNKQIAAMADAMVEGRITGVPPTVPKDMTYEDVAAAVRIAETCPTGRHRSGRALVERTRKA